MIGRAARGTPWIFTQIKALLEGSRPGEVSPASRLTVMVEHIRAYRRVHGEGKACRDLRKHLVWYFRGMPGAASFRAGLASMSTTGEMLRSAEEMLMRRPAGSRE
jgi:tRNA-dihydrouridine synthase B